MWLVCTLQLVHIYHKWKAEIVSTAI